MNKGLPQELSSLTAQLVRIKSETGNATAQKRCLDVAADYLSELKGELRFYRYSYQGAPSLVVATTKTKRPDIILSGHVDVVPGQDKQFRPRIEGDRLYGRGAMDMKGGVATLLKLFSGAVKRSKKKPSLALMLTGDEETGSRGAKYLTGQEKWRAGFVLIPEGKPNFKITNRDKGGCWVRMVTEGKPAHGAYPWLGENALIKLIGAYNKIQRLFPAPADKWQPTISLNRARGGDDKMTPNQTPGRAEAVLDIRFTPDFAAGCEEVIAKLKATAPEAGFELIDGHEALQVPESHPHIQRLLRLASKRKGKPLSLSFNHGASDASAFAPYGIPAMTSGVVGAGHHGDNEYVLISSLVDYYHLALGFIEQWEYPSEEELPRKVDF